MKQYHKTLLKGPFWLESTVLPHNEMKLDKYTFLKKPKKRTNVKISNYNLKL